MHDLYVVPFTEGRRLIGISGDNLHIQFNSEFATGQFKLLEELLHVTALDVSQLAVERNLNLCHQNLGYDFLDSIDELLLRNSADNLLDIFAAFKKNEIRNATHIVLHCGFLIVVDVNLNDFQLVAVFRG